jgi:spore coat protein U-like protein
LNFVVVLGTGLSGNYLARSMAGPGGTLLYNLYRDGARSLVWGNGFGGTGVATGKFAVGPGVGNSTRTLSFPIYGRLPPQQVVGTGNYADTITVTLEF